MLFLDGEEKAEACRWVIWSDRGGVEWACVTPAREQLTISNIQQDSNVQRTCCSLHVCVFNRRLEPVALKSLGLLLRTSRRATIKEDMTWV